MYRSTFNENLISCNIYLKYFCLRYTVSELYVKKSDFWAPPLPPLAHPLGARTSSIPRIPSIPNKVLNPKIIEYSIHKPWSLCDWFERFSLKYL